PAPAPELARMGLQLFLLSLTILFAASIIGIVVVRNNNPDWGAGAPEIPDTAWLSTGVIFLVSVFSQIGLSSVRRDYLRTFRFCMLLVLVLGFLFLFLQDMVWKQMLIEGEASSFNASSSLHGWSIYVLGLLHALHVGGGLIFQGYVTTHALRGGYWSLHHELVGHVNLYWHFLDAVWVTLFAFLLWLA
ncbi:MAG: hypothetical protein AAEJ04_11035, partial [Planctomycetota bacterium]